MKFDQELKKITKVRYNADIGKNSWIGCGGVAEMLISPCDIDELCEALKLADKFFISINIIGARSNTIVMDGIISGLTIWLKKGFNDIKKISDNKILVGCGVLDLTLANFAGENNISGLEFLIGIPGTIGGNIRMNAGCYGSEMKDILESVSCVDFKGNIHNFNNTDIEFSYRKISLPYNLIFINCILGVKSCPSEEIFAKMDEISQKRKKTQPIGRKTVGSTFKNPKYFTKKSFELIQDVLQKKFEYKEINDGIYCDKIHSWMLIDASDIRGFQIGGAKISEIHCNFLVNEGGAIARDFINLGEHIIAKVYEKFGVKLQWEVERLGLIK